MPYEHKWHTSPDQSLHYLHFCTDEIPCEGHCAGCAHPINKHGKNWQVFTPDNYREFVTLDEAKTFVEEEERASYIVVCNYLAPNS